MRWSWLVVVLAGCYQPRTLTAATDGAPASDGDTTLVDGQPGICFGDSGSLAQFCMPALPPPLALMSSIDTDTDSHCMMMSIANAPACVITPDALPAGILTVSGQSPLVIVSVADIKIQPTLTIEFASASDGTRSGGCVLSPPTSPAGGAGGTYAEPGGRGGDSISGIPSGANPTPMHAPLLAGGCPGGPGGGAGAGGLGGGALVLMSHGSIDIAGTLDVSGAGGVGTVTTSASGGAGGGAGGLIYLDVPDNNHAISLGASGALLANGGGGAGGQEDSATKSASDGTDAIGRTNTAAPGGEGPTGATAGHGGHGSFTGTAPASGFDGLSNAISIGAGGGGGGKGYILVHNAALTITLGGFVSPTSTTQ